jgi:hypothetical protein
MCNTLGLYFQMEVGDPKSSLSLIELALDRLKALEQKKMEFEYFELRLSKLGDAPQNKQVSIKLDGEGHTFIDSETSSRWDDAFLNAFDRIQDQLTVSPGSVVRWRK